MTCVLFTKCIHHEPFVVSGLSSQLKLAHLFLIFYLFIHFWAEIWNYGWFIQFVKCSWFIFAVVFMSPSMTVYCRMSNSTSGLWENSTFRWGHTTFPISKAVKYFFFFFLSKSTVLWWFKMFPDVNCNFIAFCALHFYQASNTLRQCAKMRSVVVKTSSRNLIILSAFCRKYFPQKAYKKHD